MLTGSGSGSAVVVTDVVAAAVVVAVVTSAVVVSAALVVVPLSDTAGAGSSVLHPERSSAAQSVKAVNDLLCFIFFSVSVAILRNISLSIPFLKVREDSIV